MSTDHRILDLLKAVDQLGVESHKPGNHENAGDVGVTKAYVDENGGTWRISVCGGSKPTDLVLKLWQHDQDEEPYKLVISSPTSASVPQQNEVKASSEARTNDLTDTRTWDNSTASSGLLHEVIKHQRRRLSSDTSMPTLTMAAADTIPSGGNEFGITNVSSKGNVSITVVPPRQISYRGKSEERGFRTTLSQSPRADSSVPRHVTNVSLNTAPSEGHEQSELDAILLDLLGESHTLETKTVPTRKKTPEADVADIAGSSWLEQQQRKLVSRQHTRDREDASQLYKQQKELVTELKGVQNRLRSRSEAGSDHNANIYTTERSISVTSPAAEPSAYTVYIKPDEFKKKQDDSSTRVTKKSVTNVSHTHHTHYNFHDNSGDEVEDVMRKTVEEQKSRIAQLEEELKKVKMGLEQTSSQPAMEEDDDEEMLFKPVGIASLESGTANASIRLPSTTSSQASSSVFESPKIKLSNVPTKKVLTPNGQSTIQAHILPTQSSYGGTVTSPSSSNGVTSPHYVFENSSLLPSSIRHKVSSQGLQSPDYGHSISQQQRITMEEQRMQQHVYQPGMMGHMGTLSSQSANQSYFIPLSNMSVASESSKLTPAYLDSGHGQYTIDSPDFPTTDHLTAKFVKDTSKYWYRPNISREQVISMLKNAAPGTFIVRDSNSFPGAFGLAIKVAHLPPNVQPKPNADPAADYVRFYLIEPTTKGVRLKGCSNEPVFASLASLIYQHTITPLALPCKLLLPDPDQYQFASLSDATGSPRGMDEIDRGGPPLESPGLSTGSEKLSTANDLLRRGAACSVVYMNCVDTESLTGPQAISRALQRTFAKGKLDTTIATFKVAADGITVTDTNRRMFFRYHFPKESISYCGTDPADRRFNQILDENTSVKEAKIFGFVAKKKGGNQCLLFAEYDPEQPSSAIVNFVTKVLLNK